MLLRRRPKVPPHSDPFPTLGRRQSRSGYLVNRTTTDGLLRLLPPPPAVIHCAIGGSVFLSATGSVSVSVEGKGQGNTKNGNKYLAWAYLEAANFAVRYNAAISRYLPAQAAQDQ